MTVDVPALDVAGQMFQSIRSLRNIMPRAGFGLTAAALADRHVAAWAAANCATVFADDYDDVRFALSRHARPVQLVLGGAGTVDDTRRAITAGVTRFVASTARDVDVLSGCTHRTAHVYLDAGAPVPEPRRRVEIVGLHCQVDDSDGYVAWGSAAERLLCRAASLRSCGVHPRRLFLVARSPGSAGASAGDDVAPIAAQVDDALREGCDRWRLARPAVTVAC